MNESDFLNILDLFGALLVGFTLLAPGFMLIGWMTFGIIVYWRKAEPTPQIASVDLLEGIKGFRKAEPIDYRHKALPKRAA